MIPLGQNPSFRRGICPVRCVRWWEKRGRFGNGGCILRSFLSSAPRLELWYLVLEIRYCGYTLAGQRRWSRGLS